MTGPADPARSPESLIAGVRELIRAFKHDNPGSRVDWTIEITDAEKNYTRLEEKDGGK